MPSATARFIASELNVAQPLRKGAKGKGVKVVQEWLCLNDFHVRIDRDFGWPPRRR